MNPLNPRDAECSWSASPPGAAFQLDDDDFDDDTDEDDEFEDDDEDSDEDEDEDEEAPETWQVTSGARRAALVLA
jgi:hypothetical protein